jgi:NitT/TauT family transport system substrate-binding protein
LILRWLVVGLALWASGADAAEISVSQWGNSTTGLPYAVALENGLFQKAGIDVTGIIGSAGGGTTVRNMLASAFPYGEVAIAAALAAQHQGLDVVIVDVADHSFSEQSVVTTPNSPIHGIEDLVGKRVAITSPRAVTEVVLLMALKAKGIPIGAVNRVVAGGYGQGLTMLDHDAVDAASLLQPLSTLKRDEYRTVFEAADILPPMVTLVGITTRAFATAHAAQIRAVIAGRRAGVQAIYANPAAAEATLAKMFKVSPEVAHEVLARVMKAHIWSEGNFVQAELDRITDGLRLVGEVQGEVDWKTLIDPAYLPDDLKTPT